MTTLPSRSAWNRRLEIGIRISAYQPFSSRAVTPSQKVFQSEFASLMFRASFDRLASMRAPDE